MRSRSQVVAALVNGLIVWLLPAGVSGLAAVGSSLGIGFNASGVTVHPDDWTPLVPIVGTALQYAVVTLPLAALAAWRTWVHAKHRLERGTRGWQGVVEAGACGFVTLFVGVGPGILIHRDPAQALPYLAFYGGIAAICGLLVGLLLRLSATIVLKLFR